MVARKLLVLVVAIAPWSFASAYPDCVDHDLGNAPRQAGASYDLQKCTEAGWPPVTRDVENRLYTLKVGQEITSTWGVCIVADSGAAGFVWADLEHSCADELAFLCDQVTHADPCDLHGLP